VRITNPSYYQGAMFAILLASIFSPLFDYVVVEQNIKRRKAQLSKPPSAQTPDTAQATDTP
jgi:Na+-transporting NADH:ubiquinone oxidoreductase subunit B